MPTVCGATVPELAVPRLRERSQGTSPAKMTPAAERFNYRYSEAVRLLWLLSPQQKG